MTNRKVRQNAWRNEADVDNVLTFQEFRSALIHETPDIRNFLDDPRGERFIISGPKGFGRTLLLFAKSVQQLERTGSNLADANGSANSRYPYEPHVLGIDRPRGLAPSEEIQTGDLFKRDTQFWERLWSICIMIAAVTYDPNTISKQTATDLQQLDAWSRASLLNRNSWQSPCILFGMLVNENASVRQRAIRSLTALETLFRSVTTSLNFFIDGVDEYLSPFLETSKLLDSSASHSNKSTTIWMAAQLGLCAAAQRSRSMNRHVHVYCTIRREALVAEHQFGERSITNHTLQIHYDGNDLRDIFRKQILLMSPEQLCEPNNSDPIEAFFGSNLKSIRPRGLDQREPVLEFILRHSLQRPRNLIALGAAIATLDPQSRTEGTVEQEISYRCELLVNSLLSDLKSRFPLPNLKLLLPLIKKNCLTRRELEHIATEYRESIPKDLYVHQIEHQHPFCILSQIGLLGWLESGMGRTMQTFTLPQDISSYKSLGLPQTETFYLIHPVLDQMIFQTAGVEYLKNYDSHNIIGEGQNWVTPKSRLVAPQLIPERYKVADPRVFVSYASSDGDSEAAILWKKSVNGFCDVLRQEGWAVARDQNQERVGATLASFMRTVKADDLIIVILSDAYLRSVPCVSEFVPNMATNGA